MIAHQVPLSMGFFQARILEWVTVSFSRGSSWPGIELTSPALAARFFTTQSPETEDSAFLRTILLTLESLRSASLPRDSKESPRQPGAPPAPRQQSSHVPDTWHSHLRMSKGRNWGLLGRVAVQGACWVLCAKLKLHECRDGWCSDQGGRTKPRAQQNLCFPCTGSCVPSTSHGCFYISFIFFPTFFSIYFLIMILFYYSSFY